jgi:hypothetical protein
MASIQRWLATGGHPAQLCSLEPIATRESANCPRLSPQRSKDKLSCRYARRDGTCRATPTPPGRIGSVNRPAQAEHSQTDRQPCGYAHKGLGQFVGRKLSLIDVGAGPWARLKCSMPLARSARDSPKRSCPQSRSQPEARNSAGIRTRCRVEGRNVVMAGSNGRNNLRSK